MMPWLLVLALASALIGGCALPAASAKTAPTVITISKGTSVFAPYILPVEPNERVTWHNDDTVAHSITTTPDTSAYLNPTQIHLGVPAGGSATLTLSHPGLYDYYDPSAAQWNSGDHWVSANSGSPSFPLAMEGVIWVQGSIAGLPPSATNPIPGKDLFTSQFLAVPVGSSVAWYNADTDEHMVTEATGWQNPINPAAFDMLQIKGSNAAPPNGETQSITFVTPGLYYYYCSAHARLEPRWHRAEPLKTASEFPIPMEGFILVVG
jgi:plastocyanin